MHEIDWETVDEVFQLALAAPAGDRPALVARLAGHTPAIAREALSLLEAYQESDARDFLEPLAIAAPNLPAAALEGARIGPYELIREIGHGGMGTVYLGRRVDGLFQHEVAIKLTRWAVPDADASRRFAAERGILASLKHPNIVTLLDGGVTATGQPFLITEYVDGEPLTVFVRRRSLPLEERLRLFQHVCAGVHVAHQHGIVHRDLKPANILVTADGIPKILDFGVAKVIDAGGHDQTQTATAPAFTPNYASPEQLRHQPVTTASDVYALGVLLYELVSGARPHESEGKPLDEVLATILSGTTTRPSQASRGIGDLPYDGARLQGDLDAIVLKAMRVEPEGRYASADEFSRDIGRFLDGQPIVARDPSFAYLARKLVARYKLAAAIAVVALAGIVAALGVAVWQRQQAEAARAVAEERFTQVRQLANALIFKVDEAVRSKSPTEARRVIVTEALQYLDRLAATSNEPGLRVELAEAYRRIGEIQGATGASSLGDRPAAVASYRRALALIEPLEANPQHRVQALAMLVGLNRLIAGTQTGADALASKRTALAIAQRWVAVERTDASRFALAAAHFTMALGDRPSEQRAHWEASGREFEALLADRPDDFDRMRNVALVDKYLMEILVDDGEVAAAVGRAERAVRLDGRRVEAQPGNRQARLDAAASYSQLAFLRTDPKEKVTLYERSLSLREQVSNEDPADRFAARGVRTALAQVAAARLAAGDAAGARTAAERSLALYAAADTATSDTDESYFKGRARLVLAALAGRAGRASEGCRQLRAAEVELGDELSGDKKPHASALQAARQALPGCK